MANRKTSTKRRRRPQPRNPIRLRWEDQGIPDKPDARRRMLREVSRTADDQAIHSILRWGLSCRTIPADELIHLNDLTQAQAKRLKTMTTAELKGLAKRQKACGKVVRS
jgi:hypothetical protein